MGFCCKALRTKSAIPLLVKDKDAQFAQLHTQGGFIVSAEFKAGKVALAKIKVRRTENSSSSVPGRQFSQITENWTSMAMDW